MCSWTRGTWTAIKAQAIDTWVAAAVPDRRHGKTGHEWKPRCIQHESHYLSRWFRNRGKYLHQCESFWQMVIAPMSSGLMKNYFRWVAVCLYSTQEWASNALWRKISSCWEGASARNPANTTVEKDHLAEREDLFVGYLSIALEKDQLSAGNTNLNRLVDHFVPSMASFKPKLKSNAPQDGDT